MSDENDLIAMSDGEQSEGSEADEPPHPPAEETEATSADVEEDVAPEVEEEPREELREEEPEEPQEEYKEEHAEEPAKVTEEEEVEEFKPQKIVYDSDEEAGGQKRVLDLADSDDERSENRENMMSRIEKYQKAAVVEEKGKDVPKISEAEMPTRGRVSSLMSMFENKAVENALEAQKMSAYKKAYGVSNRPGQVNKGIFK